MNHFEKLYQTYKEIGIQFVVREKQRDNVLWQYIIIVADYVPVHIADETDTEQLLRDCRFIEFENGSLARY